MNNRTITLSPDRPITIAVLAIGGQGGGVVSNWLVALAESAGWRAQSTSVPGVAQRTGATIYYIEIIQPSERDAVLALMPTPGDVDLVVAAEWMEAGRAMQRGLVSPDRTTLIASTHRALSLVEKMPPADGVRDPNQVMIAAKAAAKQFLYTDLFAIADENGSVISASLFGAIAASGALPFSRTAFEDAIRAGGIGVESSLRAFSAAYDAIDEQRKGANVAASQGSPGDATRATTNLAADDTNVPELQGGTNEEQARYRELRQRIRDTFPATTASLVATGLNRVVDFQDSDYGSVYLDRLTRLHRIAQTTADDPDHRLIRAVAKYLATAMSYQDVIRVADLKTRTSRFERVRRHARADPTDVLTVTEFMHPRFEELCGILPAGLGRRVQGNTLFRRLAGPFCRGRRVRSDGVIGFLTLYALAGFRKRRLKSLRHAEETRHTEAWLARIESSITENYPLAVEIAKCQRLIKGYSDTHARGTIKFDRVMAVADQFRADPRGAELLAEVREAALNKVDADEIDAALEQAMTRTTRIEPSTAATLH